MNPAQQLVQLRWYQTRFKEQSVEADFREWRIWRTLPLVKLASGVSLPIWLVAPLIWFGLLDGIPWLDAIITYGLIVPMLCIGLFIEKTPLLRWAPETVFLALTLVGSEFIYRNAWGFYESANAMTIGAVLFGMFAPLMRIPPKLTALSLGFLLLPSGLINLSLLAESPTNSLELLTNIIMLTITAFIIAVMTFANELSLRRSYLNELLMQKQQTAIRRYLPSAVAEHILEGRSEAISQPQRRRVTVLFADIAGFTDMADRVEPEVMTEVLNDHLSAMSQIIEAHDGTLNEFAGDGLMALFGAPRSLPAEQQVHSAIKTAQAMQARMPELNKSWRKLGLGTELAIRIGINTGMVSVGSYGSEGRMTYTAIGLQTNIASRIEAAANPGQTFISDSSYQLIHDAIPCEPVGHVDCKGVHFPVKVYTPMLKS